MKHLIIFILIIAGGLLTHSVLSSEKFNFSFGSAGNPNIEIEKKPAVLLAGRVMVEVNVADDNEERMQGLSGTTELAENTGMYFVFERPDRWGIWMKDMNYDIDIIWISEDRKIVDVKKGAKPESYPQTYKPKSPAKYVLEVRSGFFDANKLKIGDTAILQ